MIAVREDLTTAHRLAWEHLARPGHWWTGAERTSFAETVLLALADDDPAPPWVPFTATDRAPADRCGPDPAHDVAYRIARHAGTVTEDVARTAMNELGELPYVELCAVVSSVAAVAHFCRNIGAAVPPLPEPEPGEPSRDHPELAVPALNWVPVAAPADESAAVVQAYSAVPGEDVNTWRLAAAQYMPVADMAHPDWARASGLTRPQMELVATRVAQLRECFY